MKKTVLRRKKALKPGLSWAPAKLANTSRKRRKKDCAYRNLLDLKCAKCFCCPNEATSRHHLYQQSKWPELSTERLNLVPLCLSCHQEAHKSCENFREVIRSKDPVRMQKLDVLSRVIGKDNSLRRLVQE